MRVVGAVLLVVSLLAAAGCGGRSQEPSGKPSPSGGSGEIGIPPGETGGSPTYPDGKRPTDLTLRRTGGIAGVNQRVDISAEGRWTFSDEGARKSGRLTDQQVSKLQSLVLDDRLRTEAKHKDTRKCADGFHYTLRTGDFSMTAVECGGFEERPAFTDLVNYIKKVTPM